MKTSNFGSINNLTYNIDATYLEIATIGNQGIYVSWLFHYGPISISGTSATRIRITNKDNTTVDLYFPVTWTTSSTKVSKKVYIPLNFKNIQLIQNASLPVGGQDNSSNE